MKYVALLRGINVGKGKRVDMKTLKSMFESLGYTSVSTYINSGNVLFEGNGECADIRRQVEAAIKQEFGAEIPTLIITGNQIVGIASDLPAEWKNDSLQKSDVAFLFPEIDAESTIEDLPIKREFIDIRYVKGAICWNVSRENYNKSHLNKIISHKFYKLMTVRNVNTARYLAGKTQQV
jgi:uncharacterized protein (DUF1697 family)